MPNPDSIAIMSTIDLMPLAMRLLVYEFGFSVVWAMLNEGYEDPCELRRLLEARRHMQQEAWLATDYFAPRTSRTVH